MFKVAPVIAEKLGKWWRESHVDEGHGQEEGSVIMQFDALLG
jgi:hypothetical protein